MNVIRRHCVSMALKFEPDETTPVYLPVDVCFHQIWPCAWASCVANKIQSQEYTANMSSVIFDLMFTIGTRILRSDVRYTVIRDECSQNIIGLLSQGIVIYADIPGTWTEIYLSGAKDTRWYFSEIYLTLSRISRYSPYSAGIARLCVYVYLDILYL